MIRIPRWLVNILAILFAVFHASLGATAIENYHVPTLAWLAIGVYLAAAVPTIFAFAEVRMPVTQAILNLAAAALVPLLVNNNLPTHQIDNYSVWYVAAIGFLMGVTAVRQHKWIAWVGFFLMLLELVVWAGPEAIFRSGLTGSFLLVFAGHALSVGIASASKSIAQFNEQTLMLETEKAATTAARIERQALVSKALNGAVPMLQLIRNQHGDLSESQKLDSRMLEAALRDEIRGRGLMNDLIRTAALEARRRGVEVIILDEGGLDKVADEQREEILATVADAIANVGEGRITLRAPAEDQWKVTLVATRPGVASPDVWLRI